MSSKTYHIKLNGKVYEVEIEEVKEGQNVAATSTPKEEPQQEVKKAQPVSSGESITAPMPGTITNILGYPIAAFAVIFFQIAHPHNHCIINVIFFLAIRTFFHMMQKCIQFPLA